MQLLRSDTTTIFVGELFHSDVCAYRRTWNLQVLLGILSSLKMCFLTSGLCISSEKSKNSKMHKKLHRFN